MEDRKREKFTQLIKLVALTTSAKTCVDGALDAANKIIDTNIELEDGDIPFDVGARVKVNLDAIETALAELREMGW